MSFRRLNDMVGRNSDQQAALFQLGNEEALAFFFQEFHAALALYAFRWVQNRFIAEEIASEAFVKTWKMHWKLGNYPAIRSYLYITVRRDSQLALKREKRRTEIHKLSQPPEITNDNPFDQTVRTEVYRLVHSALRNLSPGNRKILTMHYLEGKSTGQIARELNLSPSTVKTQKTRGLKALRKKILRPLLFVFYLIVKIFLPFL